VFYFTLDYESIDDGDSLALPPVPSIIEADDTSSSIGSTFVESEYEQPRSVSNVAKKRKIDDVDFSDDEPEYQSVKIHKSERIITAKRLEELLSIEKSIDRM